MMASAVGIGLALLLDTAAAHHSFAIFDATQSLTLQGVVKDSRRTNPHVFIQLMAAADAGVVHGCAATHVNLRES